LNEEELFSRTLSVDVGDIYALDVFNSLDDDRWRVESIRITGPGVDEEFGGEKSIGVYRRLSGSFQCRDLFDIHLNKINLMSNSILTARLYVSYGILFDEDAGTNGNIYITFEFQNNVRVSRKLAVGASAGERSSVSYLGLPPHPIQNVCSLPCYSLLSLNSILFSASFRFISPSLPRINWDSSIFPLLGMV